MRFYLAPMEGVTGYIYRNAYHDLFSPMDKYFAPFIVPQSLRRGASHEIKDILPENNRALPLVPQILTNNADDFIRMARELQALGYEEVNLNLGCPSGTVVAKGKGAGFLAQPMELDRFLYKVFSELDMKISVKTRLGMEEPEEFEDLLCIYNRYAMEELIIHPRVRKDMYKNRPNMDAFEQAFRASKNCVVYNGDIFSVKDYEKVRAGFPGLDAVMLGRGVISSPELPGLLKSADSENGESGSDGLHPEAAVDSKKRLRKFHDRLLHDYGEIMSGERNLLFRMKELWSYMGAMFPEGAKPLKKIKKSQRLAEYNSAVDELFSGDATAIAPALCQFQEE